MRFLITFCLSILISFSAFAGPPILWGNGKSTLLQPGLDLNGLVQILAGSLNPTSTPVNAPAGSLYMSTGTATLYFKTDAGSSTNWSAIPGALSTGTVTSVGLSDASTTPLYSISGSPVTVAGTLAFTLATQAKNLVLAGPTTGANAQPTMRALVGGDMPAFTGDVTTSVGTVATTAAATQNNITSIPNLVTVGTIGTGVWAGTTVAANHGGTGVTALGNFTDAGTDGITVTGGTGAVITNASIAQHVADTTHAGYLSSADWNTFHGATGTVTSVTFTGDGTVLSTTPSSAVTTSGTVTATLIRPMTEQLELLNVGLATSISSGALTIALKQSDGSTDPASNSGSVKAGFRSSTATSGAFNERSVTAALSQTISSGTALGGLGSLGGNFTSSFPLWIYLIDSDGAGTMKIGASTVKLDENQLQSSVAESFSATATSASPAVFTATGHGLNNGDAVSLTGTAPTGFTNSQKYYVASKAANTFQLSLTPSGTGINSSSTGSSIVVHVDGSRLVSGAVYASMPVRLIGRLFETFVTGGTWVAPTELDIGNLIAPQDIGARLFASSTSISGSLVTVAWTTTDYDTHNEFDPGLKAYVVPFSGKYQFNYTLVTSGTFVAGNYVQLTVLKNGTVISQLQNFAGGASGDNSPFLSDTLNLVAGDYLQFQVLSTATGPAIAGSNTQNYVSIKLVN